MSLTTYGPSPIKQAGYVKIAFGPKITNLAAPSLAALTVEVTCAVVDLGIGTDATMEDKQYLCDTDSFQWLEKRTRTLGPLTIRSDPDSQTAVVAALSEDAEIGVVIRPYDSSKTAFAVGDAVWAFNASVAKFDPQGIAVGNEYQWLSEFYGVTRDLEATLTA